MKDEEIRAAAWKEFLRGAESALDDWINDDYGPDIDAVHDAQWIILRALKAEHS